MHSASALRWARLVTVCVGFTSVAGAQVVTGSVVGTVVDSTGGSISGANVKLRYSSTGAVRGTSTGVGGEFTITGLPPGVHTLVVEAPGFMKYERKNVVIATTERLALGEISLAVGSASETVTVTAEGTTVQTAGGEKSGIVTSSQMESLTVINRDFASLVALQPGVVENPGGETQGFTGAGSFNVLGGRVTGNNMTIDGQANDSSNAYMRDNFVSMDSVAEVRILTSNYQAEFGRKPGATIQAITKGGSRAFHGTGYWFKRHEQFNANNFFNNRSALVKPLYRHLTTGGNIGGPIYIPGRFNRDRHRLFFFASHESLPERRPASIAQLTMPTALERAGDFSQSFDLNGALITVRDPLSKTGFPGNIIPQSRINRNGQNYLKVFPQPNFFDTAISGRRYNYQFQESLKIPKRIETARVDYIASSATTLYGRFNNWWENIQGNSVPGGGANAVWPWLPSDYYDMTRSLLVAGSHILSPTLIVEGNASASRTEFSTQALHPGDLTRITKAAVGFDVPQFHPELNPYNLVPQATFSGVTGAASTGYDDRFPLWAPENTFTASFNLSRSSGRHSLKIGLWAEHWRTRVGDFGNFAGRFAFDRNTSNPNDSNHPYANALLGNFYSYTEATARPVQYGFATVIEWYAQDNWRVNRNLTLDFGVRFGWSQPWHSGRGDEAGFVASRWKSSQAVRLIRPALVNGVRTGIDPVTGTQFPAVAIGAIVPDSGSLMNGTIVARESPNAPLGLRGTSGIKAAPRLGFAYDPFGNGKTAIRGGIGIFYQMYEQDNYFNGLQRNPPLRFDPILYYGDLNTFAAKTSLMFPSATSGYDGIRPITRVINYSFGVQRSVGFRTVVDVSYVGALSRHLQTKRNINSVPLGANFLPANQDPASPGSPLSAAFLRPYIGYNDINIVSYDTNANYHSLQTTANRRFAKGLQFGAAWTWSKAMNYADTEWSTSISTVVDPRVWNYGKAGFDRTHIFKGNWAWELPKASRICNTRAVRAVIDDWQFSGIVSFVSGAPTGISPSFTYTTDITGSPTDGPRVVVVAKPTIPRSERTFSRNFNTAAFAAPAAGTVGNAPKDVVRRPGINNWDFTVIKKVPLRGERFKAQLRTEFYNAFNHTQFSGFDTGARFDRTGAQTNTRLSEFNAARQPRRIQVALRVSF